MGCFASLWYDLIVGTLFRGICAHNTPVNNRFDKAVKNALVAAGGTGFTYPPCSAPAYASGRQYAGGSQVSYGG